MKCLIAKDLLIKELLAHNITEKGDELEKMNDIATVHYLPYRLFI